MCPSRLVCIFCGALILAIPPACSRAIVAPTPRSSEPPPATALVGVSGMAPLDACTLLVVHDTKHDEDGPRIGVLKVRDDGPPRYAALEQMDWSGKPGHDIEAICAVPGASGEFLICESGSDSAWQRLFHARVAQHESLWRGRVLQILKLPENTRNVEGVACYRPGDAAADLVVVLGERGGSDGGRGKLRWVRLAPGSRELSVFREATIAAPDWPDAARNRDCSELHVSPDGRLWLSACEDRGDTGPFRSVIYCLGALATLDGAIVEGRVPPTRFDRVWTVDGFKVEGLGPACVGEGLLSIATDDEDFGGIWRPLPRK